MTYVQPLHRRRGRPRSSVLRVYGEHFPDHSRRALYYRAAYDRTRVAMVEGKLADKDTAHPLPLRVMYEIGRVSRSDSEVLELARVALVRRQLRWSTAQLLHWLRDD